MKINLNEHDSKIIKQNETKNSKEFNIKEEKGITARIKKI